MNRSEGSQGSGRLTFFGVVLFSAGVLLWLAPGRMDMIDGQFRYEVAKNLWLEGSPDLRDPGLPGILPGMARHSSYAIGASLAGVPLVALGLSLGSEFAAQFLFSLVTPLFGAFMTGVVFASYRRLGFGTRASIFWAFAMLFCTQVLPTALSVFDQVQEAFFLMVAAYLLLGREHCIRFAAAGLFAGMIAVWQTGYVVLAPVLLLSVLPFGRFRDAGAWQRTFAFAGGVAVGPALALLYNLFRFGDPTQIAVSAGSPRFANPLVGLSVLLVSPGKSIFLYSPAVLLGICGFRELRTKHPGIARFVACATLGQLVFVASLVFVAGDWCWGPRYLAVTLPLVLLGAPFAAGQIRRSLVGILLGLSLSIQLLGISIDHHRFFFDRALAPQFWTDRSFYFRESALLSRPFEIATSFSVRLPHHPPQLFPGPYPNLPSYATFGPPRHLLPLSAVWQRSYPGLYWPRPWPLWSRLYGTHEREPILAWTELFLVGLVLTGGALIARSLRKQPELQVP